MASRKWVLAAPLLVILIVAAMKIFFLMLYSQNGINLKGSTTKPEMSHHPVDHHVFSGRDGCDIIFFVRTATTKEKYVQQTHNILNTWGRHAEGRLVFLSDNANPAAIDHFRDNYPNLAMFLVEGAERVKYYYLKNRTMNDLRIGWAATRLEMRALYSIFFQYVRKDRFRWMCLTNADMYINVPRLTKELQDIVANPPRSCARADRCAVANVLQYELFDLDKVIYYFSGGHCMRTETLEAVHSLLQLKTDAELEWLWTEDLHLSDVLNKHLGLEWTDSIQMLDSYGKYYLQQETNFSRPYRPIKLSMQHPKFKKTKSNMPLEFLVNTTIIHPKHLELAMKKMYKKKHMKENDVTIAWHNYVETFQKPFSQATCQTDISESFNRPNTSGSFYEYYALDKNVVQANAYYPLKSRVKYN